MIRAIEIACRLLAALPYIVAALIICALYVVSIPFVWLMGRRDDFDPDSPEEWE